MKVAASALVVCAVLGQACQADEACLIRDENCVSLREYLLVQRPHATIDEMRAAVGDILVAEFYPNYPASDEKHCTPVSNLPELLAGHTFETVTTPFPPGTNTPPLVEYVLDNGSRYCRIGQEIQGNF